MAVKSNTGFLEARSQREGEPRNLSWIHGALFPLEILANSGFRVEKLSESGSWEAE